MPPAKERAGEGQVWEGGTLLLARASSYAMVFTRKRVSARAPGVGNRLGHLLAFWPSKCLSFL